MEDTIVKDRLPRKLKKAILGRRLSHSKISKMIKNIVVHPAKGSHPTVIEPYEFCPKCGCQNVRWSGNRVEYPERWDSGYCMRCGYLVWESDNSPYYHCLEFDGYSIR